MLRKFRWVFSRDVAIYIGYDHAMIYARGRGIVVSEPSKVFVNKVTNEVEAFGEDARTLLMPYPNVIAVRPFEDGVLSNFETISKALQYYISRVHDGRSWHSPRLVISTPSQLTHAEKCVIEECGYAAGASKVYLVDSAVAAAIGAGMPIFDPHGNLVVHVDRTTTSTAVISYGGVICSNTGRVGVEDMNEAIAHHFQSNYNLLVGERTVDFIRQEVGSAFPLDEPLSAEVRGHPLNNLPPRTITITDEEVFKALASPVTAIANAVRVALQMTPPELSADIVERGLVLTGEGALLKELDKRLSIETGLPVSIADDPESSVVLGIGKLLSDFEYVKRVQWQRSHPQSDTISEL